MNLVDAITIPPINVPLIHSICYNITVALPYTGFRKGVYPPMVNREFVISVAASIVAYYLAKGLDCLITLIFG